MVGKKEHRCIYNIGIEKGKANINRKKVEKPVTLASESSSGSSGTETAAAREEPSEHIGKFMGVNWLENHLDLSPITPGSIMLVCILLNVMLLGERLHSQKYSTA